MLGAFIWLLIQLKTSTRLTNEISPNRHCYQRPSDNLTKWLDKLETYENCPIEGMVDKNGKKSYSCLCFQLETFQRYFKKYYPQAKDIEEQEWLNLISDCELQKDIAYKMISANHSNWKNWYWSIAKRGLEKPPIVYEKK